MAPQVFPEAALVQFSNPHPVFVGGDVLGRDVHGYLAEKQIGADPRGGGDAGRGEHIQQDGFGQLPGRQPVGVQIVGHIQKYLVDGIDDDVLRGYVFQIQVVDSGAVFHIVGHPGRGHDVVHRQFRMGSQFPGRAGAAGQPLPRCGPAACLVYRRHPLHHLKQPCPAGDAAGFQRGGHR